jgi:thiamine-phosphate pyrophosphorylase
VDLGYVSEKAAPAVVEEMIKGGVDLIQLRGKERAVADLTQTAVILHRITSLADTPLIINDYADIAATVPVEGVHVGQDDEPISIVREKAGRDLWVGKSTHSLEQARAAQQEGADYLGFGPIFATPTKPDYRPLGLKDIKLAYEEATIPIFCIGGIKLENLEKVVAAGARRVVIVSGLLKARDVAAYAREAKQLLTSTFEIRHSTF